MKRFSDVVENESLKKHNTFGLGGKARYLVRPKDVEELKSVLALIKENNMKYYVLGNGSNVILDDQNFDGVIIKLDHFNKIEVEGNVITAESGVLLPQLVNIALQNKLVSLAFAAGIPGTVGGSVVGNAGCYGSEMLDYLKSVKVLNKEGEVLEFTKNDISFGYRYTSLKDKYIVLEASFICEVGDNLKVLNDIYENSEKRKMTQPIDKKNVGSIFRNPQGDYAGRLIEKVGLKGIRHGGAMVSSKHANFIVNEENATFRDVTNLIVLIKERVKTDFDIDLVVEPSIVRWSEL